MIRFAFLLIAAQMSFGAALTLDDCLAMAEKNNFDIRISEKDLQSSEISLKSARNRFWDVTGSGSYSLTGDDDDHLSSNLTASAGVSATVSPYLFHNYRYAAVSGNSSEVSSSDVSNSVRYKVISSFFQTLLAEENLKLQKEISEYSQKKFEEAELKFNMGNISRSDLLNFEVSRSSDQIDLKSAESNLKKNRQNLIYYMNADIDPDSLELSFDRADTGDGETYDGEELIDEALQNRPDVKLLKNSLEQRELSLKMQYDSYLPSLTGSVSYDYTKHDDLNDDFLSYSDDGITGRIGLSVNLTYSGLHGIDREKVELSKSRLSLENKTESVKNDVRLKLIELENQKNNLDLARKHVELAQENLDLADKLFFIGNKSATDYLSAKNDYINAKYRQISSEFNYILAKYDLFISLGRKL